MKSLVDSHPLDLNYKVMFGNWLLQNGKKKEAVKLYRNVLKEEPTNALAKLSLLDYYRTIGDQATVDVITQELLQSPKTEKETKIALLRQVISSNQQQMFQTVQR